MWVRCLGSAVSCLMSALRCQFVGQWRWFVGRAGLEGSLIVWLRNWLWRVVAGELAVPVEWKIECLCVVDFDNGFGELGEFDVFGEWADGSGSG